MKLNLFTPKFLLSAVAATGIMAGLSSCKNDYTPTEDEFNKALIELNEARKQYLQDSMQHVNRAPYTADYIQSLNSLRTLRNLFVGHKPQEDYNQMKAFFDGYINKDNINLVNELDKSVEQAENDVDIAQGKVFQKSKQNYRYHQLKMMLLKEEARLSELLKKAEIEQNLNLEVLTPEESYELEKYYRLEKEYLLVYLPIVLNRLSN